MTDGEWMTEAARLWPRTNSGGKLACPDCGGSGYMHGKWMIKHREHRRCECGKVITAKGLRMHQVHCGYLGSRAYP